MAFMSRLCVCLLALCAAAVGCTLIFNEDDKQCTTNDDCRKRGGVAFQYSQCDTTRHVCVSAITPKDGGEEVSTGCKVHTDCTPQGPFACVLGECRNLKTNACPEVFRTDALNHSEAYGIGIIAKGYGAAQEDLLGQALSKAALVAHDQFSSAAPALSPATGARTFVVRCDENQLQAAFDHLSNLGVNVIVGPQLSENAFPLIDAAGNNKSVLILPVADDPRLEQGNPLGAATYGTIWGVRPNRRREVKFVKTALEKAGELLAAAFPTDFTELRVAYVIGTDPASKALQSELSLPTNSQTFQLTTSAELAQTIASQNPLPNLIVASSDADPWNLIIQNIESAWPAAEAKPWYVLRDRWDRVLLDVGEGFVPRRILGITFARSDNAELAYKKFVGLFKSRFQNNVPQPKAEYGYDAMSLAMMGAFLWRTSEAPPDPGRLMKLQLWPTLVPPGPSSILDDFVDSVGKAQIGTQSIADFFGASGDLDLDGVTTTPSEDAVLFCLPKSGLAYCNVGLTFSRVDGSASGDLDPACDCF
jgi:hypothetical protein